MTRAMKPCPTCSTQLRQIAYGYRTSEAFESAERGEIVLGGCIVMDDAPTWACRGCGWRGNLPPEPAASAAGASRSRRR